MTGTMTPTCNLRIMEDYDGRDILQQMFIDADGREIWKAVPRTEYYYEIEKEEQKRRSER